MKNERLYIVVEKCQLNNEEWDEELDDTVEISIKPYKIIKLEQ